MTCTEEYKEHIEYTFHAFCKIVIRNASYTALRTWSRKHKREISLDYITDEKHYPLGTTDEFYSRHNRDDRPNAKTMRSVSVSDIIVTHKDNETHAFYVQPIGYKQVDNLLPELENATPSKAEQHER